MIRIILFMIMSATAAAQNAIDFKPERIQRSATIVVHASLEKAFPLFGPLLEMEWAAGWEPRVIYLESKNVGEHMIFKTKSQYGEDYLWAVTQYDVTQSRIEYTVTASERIWFIRVACKADGKQTKVDVSYMYTGLSENGNQQNRESLEKMFAHDLKDWEKAINYYLETGKQLH
jgi:hypothetical protein